MAATLDEELCKQVAKLVIELTTTGQPTLEEKVMKELKKICKKDDVYVGETYQQVIGQLEKGHAEIRLSAFLIIHELFIRSHCFRELLLADFQHVMELTLGIEAKQPLPPPKAAARTLREQAVRSIQMWQDKFGGAYKVLALGYNYLNTCKRIDFASGVAESESERQQREERERRQAAQTQRSLDTALAEMTDVKKDIAQCFTQVENCLQLLLPDPSAFCLPSLPPSSTSTNQPQQTTTRINEPQKTTSPTSEPQQTTTTDEPSQQTPTKQPKKGLLTKNSSKSTSKDKDGVNSGSSTKSDCAKLSNGRAVDKTHGSEMDKKSDKKQGSSSSSSKNSYSRSHSRSKHKSSRHRDKDASKTDNSEKQHSEQKSEKTEAVTKTDKNGKKEGSEHRRHSHKHSSRHKSSRHRKKSHSRDRSDKDSHDKDKKSCSSSHKTSRDHDKRTSVSRDKSDKISDGDKSSNVREKCERKRKHSTETRENKEEEKHARKDKIIEPKSSVCETKIHTSSEKLELAPDFESVEAKAECGTDSKAESLKQTNSLLEGNQMNGTVESCTKQQEVVANDSDMASTVTKSKVNIELSNAAEQVSEKSLDTSVKSVCLTKHDNQVADSKIVGGQSESELNAAVSNENSLSTSQDNAVKSDNGREGTAEEKEEDTADDTVGDTEEEEEFTYSSEDETAYVRQHGLGLRDVEIDVSAVRDAAFSITETEDNIDVLATLKDAAALVKNKFLPALHKWNTAFTRANRPDLVRSTLDLREVLENMQTRISKLRVTRPADSDDDNDSDFEEVPDAPSLMATACGSQKPAKTAPARHEFCLVAAPRRESAMWSLRERLTAEDERDPTSYTAALSRAHAETGADTSTPQPSSSVPTVPDSPQTAARKAELLALAPKVPFSLDLQYWGEDMTKVEVPKVVRFDSEHRFWQAKDQEEVVDHTALEAMTTRVISFPGQFEPVKWACRAPLPSGKLCPRMDRVKCPFHGVIVGRDAAGRVTDPAERARMEAAEAARTGDAVPEWEDPRLQEDILAATGVDVSRKKPRRGKQKKYPGLTDIRKVKDQTRSRLERKIFNKKTLARVTRSLDAIDAKRHHDKFGNQFHYAIKTSAHGK